MDQGNTTRVPTSPTPDPDGPQVHAAAPAAPAPEVLDRPALLQRAYLLEQLESRPGMGETVAVLNRRITKVAQRELSLTTKVANAVREILAGQGYLAATKTGRTLRYALTEAGLDYLAGMERPALLGTGKTTPLVDDSAMSEEIRDGQYAYLLLQLMNADSKTLTRGEANHLIPKLIQTRLGLTPANANHRRARLAERGYLHVARRGRSEAYSLTPDGLDYLAAGARHLDHADLVMKGKALNELVAAARELSFRDVPRSAPSVEAGAPPDKTTLECEVLAEFEELLRERYGRSGLVPIHEVRQRIAERFGPAAGRHNVLDEVILDLWRQGRVRLEGISDLSQATPAQLNSAIPGVSGPLFYLEITREQPVTR